MYLVVNEILKKEKKITHPLFARRLPMEHIQHGRLYRNDWNPQLKHPVFTDVSKEAGITIEGYGHSVSTADFNKDGYKEIFVTNDFISNDLFYQAIAYFQVRDLLKVFVIITYIGAFSLDE
ncbi:MAG: VCBS repeat-containing protein [Bacteroidota bacterium]|nr:VCBS repeat-containing protein [Bacteroidota bacterium]